MLREGSAALASFGRVRKVHETAFAVAFGRKSVALKWILDAAFESPSSPGEATFADLVDVLLAIAFTPIDRLAFVRPALCQPVSGAPRASKYSPTPASTLHRIGIWTHLKFSRNSFQISEFMEDLPGFELGNPLVEPASAKDHGRLQD